MSFFCFLVLFIRESGEIWYVITESEKNGINVKMLRCNHKAASKHKHKVLPNTLISTLIMTIHLFQHIEFNLPSNCTLYSAHFRQVAFGGFERFFPTKWLYFLFLSVHLSFDSLSLSPFGNVYRNQISTDDWRTTILITTITYSQLHFVVFLARFSYKSSLSLTHSPSISVASSKSRVIQWFRRVLNCLNWINRLWRCFPYNYNTPLIHQPLPFNSSSPNVYPLFDGELQSWCLKLGE